MSEPRSSSKTWAFGLNRRLKVIRRLVGREREPVLVIDDVMRDPRALVEYAASEVQFAPDWGPTGGYPGIRAPAPLNYVETLVRAVAPVLERAFGLTGVRLATARCYFSLVTLRPEALAPLQRVPHVDTDDPLQFALLHYLFDQNFGGTAFYRHCSTGFETLGAEQRRKFVKVRDRELAAAPPPPGYVVAGTPHYAQTAVVDARFDRLLIYRSRLLHSGVINPQANLSADPRHGRLTANIFVNYEPA